MDLKSLSIIKNQFFDEENSTYILNFVKDKHNITNIDKNIIFQIQNKIYNSFLDEISVGDFTYIDIEKILIALNILTFQLIQKESTELYTQISVNKIQETQEIQKPTVNKIQETQDIQKPPVNKIQETQEIQKPPVNKIQETQELQELQEIQEYRIQNTNFLHLYSNNKVKELYVFEIPKMMFNNITITEFNFYNNFHNININNNKFELHFNQIKKKIIIPLGNYNLSDLINVIQEQLEIVDKGFIIKYNKNKNRIIILNKSNFELKFIENSCNFLELKDILGFSKHYYTCNNNYSSDLDNQINWLDNIYIKINIKNLNLNLNKYKTNVNNFEYFTNLNYKNIESFNKYNKIIINESIKFNTKTDISNLNLSFYIKCKNKDFKLIDFNILFDFKIIFNYL
jgi:hypothetical protein